MGDPAGLRDQVDALFLQWAQLSEEQPAEKQHNGFVGQLQQAGFLKVPPTMHVSVHRVEAVVQESLSNIGDEHLHHLPVTDPEPCLPDAHCCCRATSTDL